MFWRRSASLCRIGHSQRAVQTIIVSSSINWSQVKNMNHAGDQSMAMQGPKRMQVQKSIWRPVNSHSHSPEGHKSMKVHKSIWRPVNAHSQKSEGKENENMTTCIRNGERQYSSVTNAKSGISIDDCENLSGGNIVSISGVETTVASVLGVETTVTSSGIQTSAASISGIQTSSQDFQPESETTTDLGLSTKPIKSFISVKHVKSEASVNCITTKQEGIVDPITMVDLEDASECEQTHNHSEPKASVLSINENECTTNYEKDSMEDEHQQGDEEKDANIQKIFTNIEEPVKRHSSNVKVDAALLRFVKGKGGKVQQKIEDTTGVKLSFISTAEESVVVLDGPSAESVTAAATMIQKVLDEAVKGPNLQYSHFISLPLAIHSELKEKLTNFQNSILSLSGFAGSESASTEESSDEDSENIYEGKKVAVNLNVEENSKHVKVEMLEIPVKNEFSQKESLFSGVETTHPHPEDEISDVKAAVAVKLDVEDGNAHVNLDVKGHVVQNTQAKGKTFCSQAKKNLGIDKSIFIKPATFHLTVLMLKLWNKERVAAAADVLQKVSAQVKDALEGRPLAINLEGLKLMRGNPAKAHVLYAPVKEVGSGERLLRACRVIIDAFVQSGLVMHKDATSTLKLHATLMNTSHRKKRVRVYRSFPFDARHILELYSSENWGEYVIPEVHLSQRFKYDDNGYYHCCASIPFPEIDKGIGDATADITKEMDEVTTQKIAEVTDKEIGCETAEPNKEIGEMSANETDE